MFSPTNMPSMGTVLSTYTVLTAWAMLVRTIASEVGTMASKFIPKEVQEKIIRLLGSRFGNLSSTLTLVINEHINRFSLNEIYQASEIYLHTKITPSSKRLKVSKASQEKNFLVAIANGEEIIEVFQGVQLKWKLVCTNIKTNSEHHQHTEQHNSFELSFHKNHREMVLGSYLPYVIQKSKAIKEKNEDVRLYSFSGGAWNSRNLNHPSTFDTLAMDPVLKKEFMDDLDRFLKRRELYRRVGKAWKRGYLLYGPPGTGKSSLIAAMANYLKFNIYDLELSNIRTNSNLRNLLVTTRNRSILVIEDIDCSSLELQCRNNTGTSKSGESPLTLSGLLNFIDGLWSSCGDERLIVLTTNHKDRIDPALLRPGRMDVHICMSYCTPSVFKLLAANYLGLQKHSLFGEIEVLISDTNVTPAEVAEELLKSDDADITLRGLIRFLLRKKIKQDEPNAAGGKEGNKEEAKEQKVEEADEKKFEK